MDQRLPEKSLHSSTSRPRASAVAILSWSLLSLLPLLLSTMKVPLWSRVSPPIEQYALPMMVVTQIALAAMFHVWLFRNPASVLMVMLGSGILTHLAGMLGQEASGSILTSLTWIWMWQAAMVTLNTSPASLRVQHLATAISTTTAIGGMILIYLRQEFTTTASEVGETTIIWGALGMAIIMASATRFMGARQPIHS